MVWNSTFWVVWPIRTVMKISTIMLKKYPTFQGYFSYFHWQNKCKIQLFVDYSVRTKKYKNLKTKKKLALNYTFWLEVLIKVG